jgi:hypothetical protein
MIAERPAKLQICPHPIQRVLVLVCAVAFVSAALSVPGRAETAQDLALCKGDGNPTLQQQIRPHSLIDGKSGAARTRARLFPPAPDLPATGLR